MKYLVIALTVITKTINLFNLIFMKEPFDSAEIKVRGSSGREWYVTICDGVGYCADGGAWRDANWPEPICKGWTATQVWQIE